MLGIDRLTTRRALAVVLLALSLPVHQARAQEPEKLQAAPGEAQPPSSPAAKPAQAPPPGSPPVYIFLNAPADLEAFWKRWMEPDFVLQRGADYQKLLDQARGAGDGRAADARRWGIESLAVRGKVADDLARLTLELNVVITGEAPVWVPIRLDELTVTDAREGDRPLELRDREGGWQVSLAGAGAHAITVELLVPIKPAAEGRRLELTIPEVVSTRVQLDLPQAVTDAVAGARDVVAVEPIDRGKGSRLSAHLTPRRRLELAWRPERAPGLELPELVAARGEISVEVDAGSLRTRSTWVVSAARGTVRTLVLKLDRDDELLDIELDDEPLGIRPQLDHEVATLTIPLSEPLRPGLTRRLMLATRRPLAAASRTRFQLHGFPFERASAQSGVIGVGQGGSLWIDGRPGRGVRQIDLRELPADLRGRPATVQAYQFLDQPFELALGIEPAPPHVQVQARTTVSVDAGLGRVDTWLDYQVTRGKVFELAVGLPRGLDLETAGPDDTVAAYHWQAAPAAADAATPEPGDDVRTLTLRLSPKARDGGSFRVHLVGRQSIDRGRAVAIGLFQPRGASFTGGQIAVVTARNITVDLPDQAHEPAEFSEFPSAGVEPPSDWPWPADRPAQAPPPALWLRHDGQAAALPLHVAVQPRTVHHETEVTARIDRRRLEVQQETTCHVHYGTLTRVEVAVPAAIEGLWELDGDEVISREREPARREPDGRHHYRLTLRREVADTLRLRFRYRMPIEPGLTADHPVRLPIAWVEVTEGTSGPVQMSVSADPGISLALDGQGWTRSLLADDPEAPAPDSGQAPGLALVSTGTSRVPPPPTIVATARAIQPLPSLVASRLWLRTVLGAEGDLRTSAWYRVEVHDSTIAFTLPEHSELIRARVGGETLTELERLPSGGYRLRIPPGTPTGAVVLGLEYASDPHARPASQWPGPRLLEGGLVEETLWEVAVPWSQAFVGVPAGWTDENQWFWDLYVWKRRPWRNAEALSAWVSGGSPPARARLADDLNATGRGGYHSYLFRRLGEPGVLRVWTVPRAWLVALCSGLVLGLGVLLLAWRPSAGLVAAAGLALALAMAVAVQPSITLLAAQSSEVGLLLAILAVLMQRVIDRRRLATGHFREPTTLTASLGQGSSYTGLAAVGSDDSTAIRVRPPSTREHLPPHLHPAAPDDAVADRSGLESS